MNTAARWAKSINITKQEFNEYLVKLGLQKKGESINKWKRTNEGKKHSKSILGKIYWDVNTLFKVVKLRGRITHKYFFCEECDTYHKIDIEEKDRKFYICSRCGAETVML